MGDVYEFKPKALVRGQTARSMFEIDFIVQELLQQCEIDSMPVNPVVVAEFLNVDVYDAEFTEDDLVGLIQRDEDGKINVYVRDDIPQQSKNFIIAHELGHYVLHSKGDPAVAFEDDERIFDQIELEVAELREVEANRFAIALLMPKSNVIRAWNATRSFDDMFVIFDVLPSMIQYRLNTLDTI